MIHDAREELAVRSKSFTLVEQTRDRVGQIDTIASPSDATGDAKQVLLKLLNLMRDPQRMKAVRADVLYDRIHAIQKYVDDLAASRNDAVSYPLISHWEATWRKLFGENGPKVFYSLTSDYNYELSPFTDQLNFELKGVLSGKLRKGAVEDEIYCLRLAALEGNNLPLYANIAHEFGHEVFDHHREEILHLLAGSVDGILQRILDGITDSLLGEMITSAIDDYGRELFSDIVGVRLAGAAFPLSLDEIQWGEVRGTWRVNAWQRAYPSTNFRLNQILEHLDKGNFESKAKEAFKILNGNLRDCHQTVLQIPDKHEHDFVSIDHDSDETSDAQRRFNEELNSLKAGLKQFTARAGEFYDARYGEMVKPLDLSDVAQLLRRLQHDILPNIVPDGSLRGRPAEFNAILVAAALYRAHLLADAEALSDAKVLVAELQKLERLTAKSFEVCFVQREYAEKIGSGSS